MIDKYVSICWESLCQIVESSVVYYDQKLAIFSNKNVDLRLNAIVKT
ncbi:hypothetical protein CCP2SC5_1230006 [Azospirillaceae bacterium]